ncbi:heme-copper oxidase family protein [Acidicapsa acidisoli]|uniref:hypothetical protein n=1 Tax=Acidicapsa acidisoli TaxID=1615681 RepID=UPI0021E05AEF|nr:hypothetical protein [Acidicapsa acidisoli]
MSTSLPEIQLLTSNEFLVHPSQSISPSASFDIQAKPIVQAVWHSLLWLAISNAIGVLIALLLIVPGLNRTLGEWSYGRWMPVHMNLELYGWCSLPMMAFLFKVYDADHGRIAKWCSPVLWVWSIALAVGSVSWLNGHATGKLFLDWTGYPRVLFPIAMATLWTLLATSLIQQWHSSGNARLVVRIAKVLGLCLLLAIPAVLYFASSPTVYPPINPDSGGPTGASQLESTLMIIAILLVIPFGLTQRRTGRSWQINSAWIVLAAESILCFGLGRADVGHHRPVQYISLGSLLIWLPLTPAYFAAFQWHPNTRGWRISMLAWWSLLVPTGWVLFLPGVLDHFKFTDGLVGHSLLAMAGFVTSLLIFVLVQLLGEDGWILNRARSLYVWQGSVLAYVLLMFYTGWREGFDPSYTMIPGLERNLLYIARLGTGLLMLGASAIWLIDAGKLLRTSSAPEFSYSTERAR